MGEGLTCTICKKEIAVRVVVRGDYVCGWICHQVYVLESSVKRSETRAERRTEMLGGKNEDTSYSRGH